MAKIKDSGLTTKIKKSVSRPGIHAKSGSSQLKSSNTGRIITPFRAVNNAGDILSRKNYSCGGSNQVAQSIPNVYGMKNSSGSVTKNCNITDVPVSTCNGKYVYDSSNYSTYLKQKAINKNFNDLSYGGDLYNSSQSAIRAIHRY